jgi:signal transduction histidine kinase
LLNFDNKIERKISIEKFFDYDTPPLMLDKNSIKQVLLNIINNSIEAMPEGGVLTINTRYKESEKEVELVIGDTGIGISEETLSQVFQPFFTTKDKGLGLGLNIVQKFVKEHGGYITITSTPGMGTQVTLVFPVDIDKVPEAKKEEVSSHSSI